MGIIILLLSGCKPPDQAARQEAVAAVERYVSMLRRVYLEANPELLRTVASDREVNRIYPVVEALRAAQSSMITEVDSFVVDDVQIEPGQAFVVTKEQWTYWWQHAATGTITKPRETATYRIRYRLIESGRVWKVDQLQIAD